MTTLEVCVDNIESVITASKKGVDRLELCSALGVEGLTPSSTLVSFAKQHSSCELHAMIRPRSGGFIYSQREVGLMKEDISHLSDVGVDGIVIGCLTPDNRISEDDCSMLLSHAKALNLEVTCHRAIDMVPDYWQGMQILINLGFDRVLTSGHHCNITEGESMLAEAQKRYGSDIQVMAGGGVRPDNIGRLLSVTEIKHIHCSASSTIQGGMSDDGSVFSQNVLNYNVTDEQKLLAIIGRIKEEL